MANKSKNIRADLLLVEKGLAPTRTRAQSLIMSGVVYCGERKIEKPSELFSLDSALGLKGKDHPYVSRGGVKLKAALDHFNINVKGRICLDVGASTGGFTDCLLKEGAKKVYALDVGYGQLDWSLRNDSRVVILDRVNFRYFDSKELADPIDLVTVDVSFISLTKIIPKVVSILSSPPREKNEGGDPALDSRPRPFLEAGMTKHVIALIKPQFEVGQKFVGKKGVVKNQEEITKAVEKIRRNCREQSLKVLGVIPSPIKGQEGNQEYLMATTLLTG